MPTREKEKSTLGLILPAAFVGGFVLLIALGWFVLMSTKADVSAYTEQGQVVQGVTGQDILDTDSSGEADRQDDSSAMTTSTQRQVSRPALPVPSLPDEQATAADPDTDAVPAGEVAADEDAADEMTDTEMDAGTEPTTEPEADDYDPIVADYTTRTGDETADADSGDAEPSSPFGSVADMDTSTDDAPADPDSIERIDETPADTPTDTTAADRPPADPKQERIAGMRLRSAQRYADMGKQFQAYGMLKQLADRFPATDAADTARQLIAGYEADEEFIEAYRVHKIKTESEHLLNHGENAFKMAQWESAKQSLEELVEKYPDSDAAEKGRELLAKVRRVLGE